MDKSSSVWSNVTFIAEYQAQTLQSSPSGKSAQRRRSSTNAHISTVAVLVLLSCISFNVIPLEPDVHSAVSLAAHQLCTLTCTTVTRQTKQEHTVRQMVAIDCS